MVEIMVILMDFIRKRFYGSRFILLFKFIIIFNILLRLFTLNISNSFRIMETNNYFLIFSCEADFTKINSRHLINITGFSYFINRLICKDYYAENINIPVPCFFEVRYCFHNCAELLKIVQYEPCFEQLHHCVLLNKHRYFTARKTGLKAFLYLFHFIYSELCFYGRFLFSHCLLRRGHIFFLTTPCLLMNPLNLADNGRKVLCRFFT